MSHSQGIEWWNTKDNLKLCHYVLENKNKAEATFIWKLVLINFNPKDRHGILSIWNYLEKNIKRADPMHK